jgi:hypothetical protein
MKLARLGYRPLLLTFLVLLAGCSRKSTVTGAVTFDGQKVKTGYISFLPADGKGPTAGGQIKDGYYRVANVAPGLKRIEVVGGGSHEAAKVTPATRPTAQQAIQKQRDEVAQSMRQRRKVNGPTEEGVIPPDAVGNRQQLEVKSGSQTLDINLESPKKR